MNDKKWNDQNAAEKGETVILTIIAVVVIGFAVAIAGSCIMNPPDGGSYEPEIGGRGY